MRFRRVTILTVAVCLTGVIAVSWWHAERGPLFVRFSRYGSFPYTTPGRGFDNKTAAFFLISNPGPHTVVLCDDLFRWSGLPYMWTQIRLGPGWTDAKPAPAQGLSSCKLAPGKSCEVAVALGAYVPEVEPRLVAATNLVWRLSVDYRPIGLAEQVGLDELLYRLANHCSGSVRQWLVRTEGERLRQHRHQVWSEPVIPQ
jgi:hypothetical protein